MTWKTIIAGGVCRAFSCECFQRRRLSTEGATSQTIAVGRRADIDTVKYMYAYLLRELDRLAAEGWVVRQRRSCLVESGRAWKNAFRMGAAAEVATRLLASRDDAFAAARERAAHDESICSALVRIDEHADQLAAYMAGLKLSRARRASLSSASGLDHGRAAGKRVNLGRNPGLGRPARQLGD